MIDWIHSTFQELLPQNNWQLMLKNQEEKLEISLTQECRYFADYKQIPTEAMTAEVLSFTFSCPTFNLKRTL